MVIMAPTNTDIATSDHDLLIELRTNTALNFQYLREDVKNLSDGTHVQLTDHEQRLRTIETNFVPDAVYSPAHQSLIKSIDALKKVVYMATGGWILLTILATLFFKFVLGK